MGLISNCCRGMAMLGVALLAGCNALGLKGGLTGQKLTPRDLSTIRGTNYSAAGAGDNVEFWRNYSPAETERDLGYSDRLKVNQWRVFVTFAAWNADKAGLRRNLVDLLRAANRHHVGVMVTVGTTAAFINADAGRTINYDGARAFAADLVDAVKNEPALAFWDASNEPDYNAATAPADQRAKRIEIARLFAREFRRLDGRTPVTIGVEKEATMEELADDVDVLSFHNYLPTREAIREDIAKAKAFAARTGKQVMNTEIGCVARANPYDVTLEEHTNAHVGWYIWELMITKRWGNVHGVFYADGTVRDPSIPAAMMGFFRNRGDNTLPENPNREAWVNFDDALAQTWLDKPAAAPVSWTDGLNAAERLANLLEGSQLIAMREPPTRTIELMRQKSPDAAALRGLMPKYIELLRPFERAGASATTGVRSGAIPAVRAPQVVYPIPHRAGSRTPVDTASIRGANYCYAEYGGHPGMWSNYSTAITERDLTYAQRLGINQIRCFLAYPAYEADPEKFRRDLLHLVRAADARGIGVMPVVAYSTAMQGEGYPGAEAWAKFLVDTLKNEPGLAFWDVYNEPDYPPNQPERSGPRVAFAKHMAGVFHRLDGQTPVTIGCAYEYTMEDMVNDVDVLVYHGYQQTREAVRYDIEKARLAGAAAHKPVMNDEVGCVARANPYDMAIREYNDARVGYYMWELMIVWNGRGWGDVHGIFYADGTVRDPSIPMAVMGIFRNHGPDVVLELPDREGFVTREIANARTWLANANGAWSAGLDLAEVGANLLESAQLVPLHVLPTREVMVLRAGAENRAGLRALLEREIAALQPYARGADGAAK